MTSARVVQLAREVLRDGEGPIRVAQISRDVLQTRDPSMHVAQVDRQVLLAGGAPVRIPSLTRLVLRSRRDSPYPNFPVRLFCPPSLGVRIEGGGLSGGDSLTHDQRVEAMVGGGHWTMTFGETPLFTREQLQAWRSFAAGADLAVMNLIIPLWDRRYQPFTTTRYQGATTFGQLVWRDTPDWEADEIQAVVAADADRYATEISFSYAGGTDPIGGEHFSIYGPRYGWRLYRLIRRTALAEDGVQTWETRPPLREWLGAGTGLNFDSPRCTMRADGDLAETLELLRLGKGAATFVESFDRYP